MVCPLGVGSLMSRLFPSRRWEPAPRADRRQERDGSGEMPSRMAVWKLHYHDPYPQQPYLYYVAFADQEVVDRLEESHIIHPNLEIAAMAPDPFRTGRHWQQLQQRQPELAGQIAAAPLAVALHGTVSRHESLDYLRDTLEVMTSLVGHGACAIADMVTRSWYDARTWMTRTEQGSLFNPFDHVLVVTTTESDSSCWLRTRGLRKFGRPDLSVRGVGERELEGVQKMLDRFINHLTLGGVLETDRKIQMEGLDKAYRVGAVQPAEGDPDFQNSFVELHETDA